MSVIIENEKILKSLNKTILGVLNIYLKTEQKGPTDYRHTCSLTIPTLGKGFKSVAEIKEKEIVSSSSENSQ